MCNKLSTSIVREGECDLRLSSVLRQMLLVTDELGKKVCLYCISWSFSNPILKSALIRFFSVSLFSSKYSENFMNWPGIWTTGWLTMYPILP